MMDASFLADFGDGNPPRGRQILFLSPVVYAADKIPELLFCLGFIARMVLRDIAQSNQQITSPKIRKGEGFKGSHGSLVVECPLLRR